MRIGNKMDDLLLSLLLSVFHGRKEKVKKEVFIFRRKKLLISFTEMNFKYKRRGV